MVFQVVSSVDKIASSGVVTVGAIGLLPSPGSTPIPPGSSIKISFKSNVIGWLPTIQSAPPGLTGVYQNLNYPPGPPATVPGIAVASSPNSNELTLQVNTTLVFLAGDSLWIEGVQLNIGNPLGTGNFIGSSETGFQAILSAASSAPVPDPIAFLTTVVHVGRFS